MLARYRAALARNFSVTALKTLIIVWLLIILVLTLLINNKWILGGIFLYEVLP